MNLLLLLLLQEPAAAAAETTTDTTTEADQQIGFLTETLTQWLSHLTVNMWLQALIVVGASIFLAKLFDWLCTGIFKVLTARTKTTADDAVLAALHAPVMNSVVLIGLAVATRLLQFDATVEMVTSRTLLTIGLIVWATFAFRVVGIILRAASKNQNRYHAVQDSTFPLFNNLAKVLLFGLIIYMAISIWQFDAGGWLASAGIVGLAVGFAAQDTLSNLFAGVFILADRPYRVGDYIRLDSGERGQVSFIGLRSTRVLTRDDIEITVPNAVMGGAKIINETGGPHVKGRLRIPVGAAYGSDVDQVIQELIASVGDIDAQLVCKTPEPRVRLRAFGASSLDFELLAWIPNPELRGNVTHLLIRAVYLRFHAAGIEIPYSKHDLYIKEMPSS